MVCQGAIEQRLSNPILMILRTTDPLQGRVCNSPALGFGANREIVILFLNGIHAAFAINLIDVVLVCIVVYNNPGV